MDIHSELDKLRAKRAQIKEERAAREKQIKEVLQKQKVSKMMQESRKQQVEEKEKKLLEQVSRDKAEFEKILGELKFQKEENDQKHLKRQAEKVEYCSVLQHMKKENQLRREQD